LRFGGHCGYAYGMAIKAKRKTAPKSKSSIGLVKQGAKFGVVGISNTLIDFTLFNVITNVFNVPLEKDFIVKFFSGSVAMINSFYWNRTWTFKSKAGIGESGAKFLTATLVSVYAIQPGMVRLFTTSPGVGFGDFWFHFGQAIGVVGLAPHTLTDQFVVKNVAFAMGVLASAVWNFTLYKLWAFRK
jgi:putative flippase GtrA